MNFIHIGGHDGNDHIFECVEAYGWNGIVVEPIPRLFQELSERYAPHDVICENVAVSDATGVMDFYTIDPAKYEGIPKPWPDYSSTLVREMFDWQINNPDGYMHEEKCVTITVNVVTLQQLVDKHSITHIDLLSVDAEGCDGKIVKSVKDCTVRPSIIIFEHMHMRQEEYNDVLAAAADLGYTRKNVFVRDMMLVHTTACERFLKKLSSRLGGWWWTTPVSGYDPTYVAMRQNPLKSRS
jgi:FkbM family methyltransferase